MIEFPDRDNRTETTEATVPLFTTFDEETKNLLVKRLFHISDHLEETAFAIERGDETEAQSQYLTAVAETQELYDTLLPLYMIEKMKQDHVNPN